MRLSYTFGVAALALAASFATANAQQRVEAGLLQCRGGQNVGFVVGSNATMSCVYRGERYTAQITRIGVDLGVTEKTDLVWSVYAPTGRLGRGALAGSYGGVGSNAAVGVGGGGNLLIGGSANAYALQPLSLQGQTGLNVSGGIVGLELYRGGPRRRR